jgi:hypothetical protein
MPSTITIQSIIDWAAVMTRNSVLSGAGGIMMEPGISFANDIISMLLAKPYDWIFNRQTLGNPTNVAYTTQAYQQDYVLSGATASVTGVGVVPLNSVDSSSGTPGATFSGTTGTFNTGDSGPHGFAAGATVTIAGLAQSAANISVTITNVPSATSFQAVNAAFSGLANDGGQGITNFGWFTHAIAQDWASTATVKPVHDYEVVGGLPNESIIQNPFKIAKIAENPSAGTVTLRHWPVPSSQIWGQILNFQGKPPIFYDLGSTWAPWPDELSFVLRGMMKEMAMGSAEDARQFLEAQRSDQRILMALDIKDQEQRHEAFFPELPILRGG